MVRRYGGVLTKGHKGAQSRADRLDEALRAIQKAAKRHGTSAAGQRRESTGGRTAAGHRRYGKIDKTAAGPASRAAVRRRRAPHPKKNHK